MSELHNSVQDTMRAEKPRPKSLLPSAIEDKPKPKPKGKPTSTEMDHEAIYHEPRPHLKRAFVPSPLTYRREQEQTKRERPDFDFGFNSIFNEPAYSNLHQGKEKIAAHRDTKKSLGEAFQPRARSGLASPLNGIVRGVEDDGAWTCVSEKKGLGLGEPFEPEANWSPYHCSDATLSECGDDFMEFYRDHDRDCGYGSDDDEETALDDPLSGKVINGPQTQAQTQMLPPPLPHRIPEYSVFANHAPLSNDAIANILLQCAPHSESAQSWITARKEEKAAEEKRRAAERQRAGIRKQVLQMRPKSEWTMLRAGKVASKDQEKIDGEDGKGCDALEEVEHNEEVRCNDYGLPMAQMHGIPPIQSMGNVDVREKRIGFNHGGKSYIFDDQDEQVIRGFKASARLQVLTCNEESGADIGGRVKQELRRYFDLGDE